MTPAPGVTEWWLVRHAPVSAGHGVVYGRTEFPAVLPDDDALAALAGQLPDGAVWITTPLRRAAETLHALALARGERIEPAVEADFAEQDFGDWEGRNSEELWGEITTAGAVGLPDLKPPGGESFSQVATRVAAAVERLGTRLAGRRVVVVAHAGTIRGVLAMALGNQPARALGFALDPLSVTRCDRIGADWRIQFVNRVTPPRSV